jgi:hypothetical protein
LALSKDDYLYKVNKKKTIRDVLLTACVIS